MIIYGTSGAAILRIAILNKIGAKQIHIGEKERR
jgi:hypothetical protein